MSRKISVLCIHSCLLTLYVGYSQYADAETVCRSTTLTSNSQLVSACSPTTSGDGVTVKTGTTIDVTGSSNGSRDTTAIGITKPGINAGLILNSGVLKGNAYSRGIEITNNLSVTGIVNTGTIDVAGHGIEFGYVLNSNGSTAGGKITGFTDPSLYDGVLAIYNSGTINVTRSGGTVDLTAWGDESGIRIARQSVTIGDIYNTASGTINGVEYGINLAQASVQLNGSIVNNGVITGTNKAAIRNLGAITGSIVNNGELSSENGYGIQNGSIIYGNINNIATIQAKKSAGIYNSGTVNDIINSGNISGATGLLNSGTAGSVTNTNNLSGSDVGISNNGTLDRIDNFGTISGGRAAIDNTSGTIANAINNHGIFSGNVLLGGANLNLLADPASASPQPTVNGDISGNDSSAINIGNTTTFTTAGNANVGKINVATASTLALSDGNYWYASSDIANDGTMNLANNSTATAAIVGAGGTFNNNGTISLTNYSGAGDTLTINGNYVGNNGTLNLNTVLGDDSSKTDKLIINGTASGNTNVSITNTGGAGAQTIEGIEIITTQGSTSGAFTQSGRIVAGPYDYFLRQGTTSGQNGNNWYLTSSLPPEPEKPTPPEPEKPTPPEPEKPIQPEPEKPTPPEPEKPIQPEPEIPVMRPEVMSYASNLRAANTMFIMRLHDRLGETQYTDALTGEHKITSLWIRNIGGHNRSSMSDSQNKTQANRYVVQLGGDLAEWSSDGLDRWHIGMMFGYGNEHSNTRNSLNGYRSDGQTDGYSAGLYATWYQNAADKTGLYIDSWMLYNWFNNEVKGQGLPIESYKSRGITASVETGYSFLVNEYTSRQGVKNTLWLQPQAQMIWMGVNANNHIEQNGTQVQSTGSDNFQTRLGMRAYLNGHSILDEGQNREFEPFIETNWIYNHKPYGVRMNGIENTIEGTHNIGELKLGVEAKLSNNLNVWGSVAQQLGDKGYSDTQGILGVKVMFR